MTAPAPSGRQQMHWDDITPGFGVRISGTTKQKSFVAQRDLPNGRTRRVTIGAVGEVTLDEARARARDLIQDMRRGLDPKAARKTDATLAQALDEYLLVRKDHLAERSVQGYRRSMQYLSDWQALPLTQITTQMVQSRHAQLGSAKGHATANSVMRTLRVVYNHRIEHQPDLINPVKLKKRWFKVAARKRLVTPEQAKQFYEAILSLKNHIGRDYLLLLLFTGLRRGEAAGLEWDDIDLSARVIRLPAQRTKAKREFAQPMSDFVEQLLGKRAALG